MNDVIIGMQKFTLNIGQIRVTDVFLPLKKFSSTGIAFGFPAPSKAVGLNAVVILQQLPFKYLKYIYIYIYVLYVPSRLNICSYMRTNVLPLYYL